MKKHTLNLIKPFGLLIIIVFTAIACDKDFVTVESDITGAQNFTTNSKLFPFIAYNKKLDPVQTNNLPSNVLGIYEDLNYGSTTASLITQIAPDDIDPDFGDNPEIISVKLYIPYFSTLDETDDDGNSIYLLDSVYGDLSSSYKLSVIRNNYYLRDLDPESDFEDLQAYYSDAYTSLNLDSHEGDLLYSNNEFSPSANEILIEEIPFDGTVEEIEEIEDRRAPGLYIDLTEIEDLDYWKNILLLENDVVNPEITNTSDFKNFFRGLIFKVEKQMNNEGNMLFLNLDTGAKIDIRYENDGTDDGERDRSTYTFNFNSIKFNTFENLSDFITLTDGDDINGDDQLFVKGFQGSMTVIDLFNGNIIDENNNTQDALEYFKDREGKWLINEANLNFYVDQTNVEGGATEPDRIVLYDLKNKIPILDHYIDPSTNTIDPFESKIIYSPALERDEDENGVKYKIRLTEHLNRILFNDSTNVKLGLFVSTNVNLINTSKVQDALDSDTVNIIPQSSVIAPEGTILHGSTPAVPENVRANFEIFYTEPEN
ncbi:DUF4270 domain-containing protein [Olleya sp. R77988]|uniref:DUF4270 domain-containing protein n=1 Tax=Olleya sp. R77988 TaxID=3093875 RepID=UPI0037CBF7BC